MKKDDQEITLLNSDIASNNDLKKNNFKTTNVNILLNRVRLDKKRTFKKRIVFTFFLAALISSLTVYFVI
ncbi:hypothetical protein ACIJYG_02220 [Candidatus Pelagibacter bacterium nBUS_27]|uniref:hypothetical protein n=1 Tax=Candidatus Pelagibacter bacterium nBUS_27 TaxID=3374188 RepID=UPI003EBB5327